MKFVCFADLHAHMFTDFAEVDDVTGNSRFTHILRCLDFIKDYTLNNKIEYVLFAGDMFHKRKAVETKVFNFVFNKIKEFSESGLKTIMINGNHDMESNEDFSQHSLEPFKEIPNVVVLDRFTSYTVGNEEAYIFPAPYSKNAEMVKKKIEEYAYTTVNEGIERKSILLGHLGVSGAFVGKNSYAMADAFTIDDLFPHAFAFGVFGHFHKRQFLGDTKHFFYCGAPIQHNFNDEGQEKGFMVIDLETGLAEFVEIPSPKFITITDWKNVDKSVIENNYVRFQVTADEVEELTESLPENSKHRLEVKKVYEEERRIDVDFSMSAEEIVKEYARKFNPAAEEIGLEILREVL